jgi:tetratricopeptide (TPR) repeat protein
MPSAAPKAYVCSKYCYMKQLLALIFTISLIGARAQHRITFACSYYGDNKVLTNESICIDNKGVTGTTDHREANSIINRIMVQVGLPKNFVLVACDKIDNCMAVNLEAQTGQLRYIVYDKPFMQKLNGEAGTYWSAISIFAHEIGHHLSGHTIDGLGSRPDKELEADRFSGFVLYKMGATLEQAQAAMQTLPDVQVISTHPPRANRLAAITDGWNDAWQNVQREKELKQTVKLNSLDNIGGQLFDKATLALETGKNAEAIKWFNSSLNLRPGNADAYIGKARAYGELKMYRLAYTNLDTALQKRPNDAQAFAWRGRYKTLQKLYVSASLDFDKAIFLDSNCATAYTEKTILQNNLGRYADAVATAQKAVQKNYKNIHIPIAQLGYAFYQLKDYERALYFMQMALEVNPLYEYARTWGEKARTAWLASLEIPEKKQ